MDKVDYLYLIRAENGLYKIGRSANPVSRYKSILNQSPTGLSLVSTFRFQRADIIEGRLHQLYNEKRSHGEWFDLTESDITKIMQLLLAWEGEPVLTEKELHTEELKEELIEKTKSEYLSLIDKLLTSYDQFVTTRKATKILNISRNAVQQACYRGLFPNAFKDDFGCWRIPIDDLKQYKRNHQGCMHSLTDEEIIKLSKLVEETGSIRATARLLGVGWRTVRKALTIAETLKQAEGAQEQE